MYTQKVKLSGLLKNRTSQPKGNLLHAILLEDESTVATIEGDGVNTPLELKQFQQSVEGQKSTVATQDGMIHYARITKIGTGDEVQHYEEGDIVLIAPEHRDNFISVSPKEVILSDTVIMTIYKK